MTHWISQDRQKLFDLVITKLAEQGKQSGIVCYGGMFSCRYLSPEGHRCAAGWCLTDAGLEVAKLNETTGIGSLLNRGTLAGNDAGTQFIEALQDMHDKAKRRAEFRELAVHLAHRYDLAKTVIEEKLTDQWCTADVWMVGRLED